MHPSLRHAERRRHSPATPKGILLIDAKARQAFMITFTPLSGAARSSRTVPLAYLLQVDDVRILLDCGSPDWCPEEPEGTSSAVREEDLQERHYDWEKYCETLKEYVFNLSPFLSF